MQKILSNLAETIQEEKDFEDEGGTNNLIHGKIFLLLIYILF